MQLRYLLSMPLLFLVVLCVKAQDTSPYWSLSGNSNAATSSKLGTTNSIPLNLTTNNLTRLKIFENGRVGVGSRATNSNATRVLNLADDNAVMRILRVHNSFAPAVELISRTSADGANVAYWDFYAEPSDKSFRIRDRIMGGSGLDRVTVSSTGNMGIGVTDPQFHLDVAGRIRLRSGGGGATAGLWLNNSDNTNTFGFMGAVNDNHIGLWGSTGAGWGLAMNTSNGRVGIGTTSPFYPLHVLSATADRVIYAKSSYSGSSSSMALYAESVNAPGYGYGIWSEGGLRGVQGVGRGGDALVTVVGVAGSAYGNAGVGNRYGVFGHAAYGSFNAAGYFSGNVYSNGVLLTSDRKFKKDIVAIEHPLEQLSKLKPAAYQFKTNEYKGMHLPKGRQIGLIADEVKQVFPELVERAVHPAEYDKDDRTKIINPEVEYEVVNYLGLTPVLIASIQELKTENDKQQLIIDKQQQQIDELKQLVSKLAGGQSTSTSASSAALLQNVPNPVRGTTAIKYSLPEGAKRAQLLLTDALGRTIKAVQLTSSGVVNVDVSMLSSGVYNYSLVVDGQSLQTKKMTVER